nr:hypothetical protein [uncultured Arsenicibacter sp.]
MGKRFMKQWVSLPGMAVCVMVIGYLTGCSDEVRPTNRPKPVTPVSSTTQVAKGGDGTGTGTTDPTTPPGQTTTTTPGQPPVPPPPPPPPTHIFLWNGKIRLGINLNAGGGITYLSDGWNGENMVNNFDLGRQLQTSIYSGPIPFTPNGKQPVAKWWALGWNPVQTGDVYNNPSLVVTSQQIDSTRLYVKTVPYIWPLLKEPAECIMEHWIELKGNNVHVRSRTTINRRDTTQYEARAQELPCVYLNGPYYRIVSYTGMQPFTNDAVTEFTGESDLTPRYATENWTALLNKEGKGVGLYTPDQFRFVTGMFGRMGTGNEYDVQSSYMTSAPIIVMGYNEVFDYEFDLVVGTLPDIRLFAQMQPRASIAPNYRFARNRLGWHYYNTVDQGQPDNELVIQWGRRDSTKVNFQVKSPMVFWRAGNVPKVYVQAAFKTPANTARFSWRKPEDGDFLVQPERYVDFPITGDGEMRVYEIDLGSRAGWSGVVSQVALEASPRSFSSAERREVLKLRSVTAARP